MSSAGGKVAAVILAAGGSRRLGRPKQTVVLGGEMLVERAVRVAREAGLSPVMVVVRPEADFADLLRERGALAVVNANADEGMAASIRWGVRAAEGLQCSGVLVMTCDQVLVRAEHLQELVRAPERVTASGYGGRRGVPAYFPASSFTALVELRGDVGARELLHGAAVLEAEELALDLDTEEDVARAQQLLGCPPLPEGIAGKERRENRHE